MNDYSRRLSRREAEMLRLTQDQIGFDFLEAAARGIVQAYKLAYGVAYSTYDPMDAHDVCGRLRKANIEKTLKAQANLHRLPYRSQKDSNHNLSHTEIATPGMVITAARSRGGPSKMAQRFKYRQSLARNAQQALFEILREETGDAEDETGVYGLILHAPPPKMPYLPAQIRLAFPSEDFTEWVANLDLLLLCGLNPNTVLDPRIAEETIREEFDLDVREIARVSGDLSTEEDDEE